MSIRMIRRHIFKYSFLTIVAVLLPCIGTSLLRAAPVEVRYRLTDPGQVSLGIYDAKSRLIRTLLRGADLEAGAHSITWDGLTDQGQSVPAGDYEWRLVSSPGLEAEFLMQLGTSGGVWHWPGAHHGPENVAVYDDTVVASAGMIEGSPQHVALTRSTGEVKWHQRHASGFGFVTSTEAGDRALYAAGISIGTMQPELLFIDKASGEWLRDEQGHGRKVSMWSEALTFHFGRDSVPDKPGHIAVTDHAWPQGDAHPYGWVEKESDGLERVTVGDRQAMGSTRVRSGSFRVKSNLGPGRKRTIITIANPTDTPRTIEVYGSHQNKPLEGRYLLAPGEVKTVHMTGHRRPGGNQTFTFTVGNPEGEPTGWALVGLSFSTHAGRLAVLEDDRVALLNNANQVRWIDPWKGEPLDRGGWWRWHDMHVLHTVDLPRDTEYRDIEHIGDNRIALLSPTALVEVNKDGSTTVLIDGLVDAESVDYDPRADKLFIFDGGESQQVKAYTGALKPSGTFGREGGRLEGLYEASDFLEVSAVAGDGEGGFYIVEGESAPRRLARFDAAGKLIREWYGAQQFFTNMWVDPEHKDRVWIDSASGWVLECKVDYDRRTWKPRSTWNVKAATPRGMEYGFNAGYAGFQTRYHGGEKYLVKRRYAAVLRIDEQQRRLVPLSKYEFMGYNPGYFTEKDVPDYIGLETAKQNKLRGFLWTDANGDGEVQADEVEGSKQLMAGGKAFIGDDLTFFVGGRRYTPEWVDGVPHYPLPTDRRATPTPPAQWIDDEGNFYASVLGGGNTPHNFGWPSEQRRDVGLIKHAPDGTQMFRVANKAVTYPGSHPSGQVHHPSKIAGTAKGLIGLADRAGEPCTFWTLDGLFVSNLLDRPANQGEPAIAYHWWRVDPRGRDGFGKDGNQALFQYDMEAGGKLTTLDDGRVIYFGAGWNNVPTYQVRGFEKIVRDKGAITLDTAATAAPRKGVGLTAAFYDNPQFEGQPAIIKHVPDVGYGGMYPQYGSAPQAKGRSWPDKLSGDAFAVRFTGEIEPPITDAYDLFLYLPKGGKARLWIDGKKVIDNWTGDTAKDQFKHNYRGETIPLQAGKRVPVRIEYTPDKQDSGLFLAWESIGQYVELVPTEALYVKPRQHRTDWK